MKWCLQVMIPIWWIWSNVIGTFGDVGTAASYNPPYLPTKCGGYSDDQFPENGFFASVSEGLWDNGAACGRRYEVCCISGPNRPCKNGNIIATVVDFCRTSPCPATMVLSRKAFSAISRSSTAKINIEYAHLCSAFYERQKVSFHKSTSTINPNLFPRVYLMQERYHPCIARASSHMSI